MWWVIGFFILLISFPVVLKILPPILFKKLKNYTLLLNTYSLHSQYLFQVVILLPLILSLYFMIWIGSEYPFRLDSIGFNSFLNIQKFSLGILALSPILGAFVVYAHRSLQTEKQIKTTEKQLEEAQKKNKIDIYFSKRKFINEQLALFKTQYGEVISQPVTLYNKAFLLKKNHEDLINEDFFKDLNNSLLNIGNSFTHLKLYALKNGTEDFLWKDSIKKLDKKINKIKKTLCIDVINIINNTSDNKESPSDLEVMVKVAKKMINTVISSDFLANIGSISAVSNEIHLLFKSVKEVISILSMDDNIDILLPCFNETLSIIIPFDPLDKNGT